MTTSTRAMTRWTHALRRPGPTPDRCTSRETVSLDPCGCDKPEGPGYRNPDALHCTTCRHEVVPVVSLRPTDSPAPPR